MKSLPGPVDSLSIGIQKHPTSGPRCEALWGVTFLTSESCEWGRGQAPGGAAGVTEISQDPPASRKGSEARLACLALAGPTPARTPHHSGEASVTPSHRACDQLLWPATFHSRSCSWLVDYFWPDLPRTLREDQDLSIKKLKDNPKERYSNPDLK